MRIHLPFYNQLSCTVTAIQDSIFNLHVGIAGSIITQERTEAQVVNFNHGGIYRFSRFSNIVDYEFPRNLQKILKCYP